MPRLKHLRPPGEYAYLLKHLAEHFRDQCGLYNRDRYRERIAAMKTANDYWRRHDRAARRVSREEARDD